MTNEEAIKLLSQIKDVLLASNSWLPSTHNPIKESFGMAINALTAQEKAQEVSNNSPELDKENGKLISRKAAIDACLELLETRRKWDTAEGRAEMRGINPVMCAIHDLPSAQPETHEERTETHACDCISRSAQPERLTDDDFETIRIHLNAYKEKLCNQHRWEEADEYQRIIDRFMAFASAQAQPDLSGYSDKLWKAAYERGRAEAQQRWIPCSERLPEPRMAVLGYAPRYQNIYALYYDTVCGWMVWSPIRDDCFPNSQGEIVAWMPLPESYKEGEG